MPKINSKNFLVFSSVLNFIVTSSVGKSMAKEPSQQKKTEDR